jgi:hypothetical protein
MRKLWFIAILLPLHAASQEVKPILSADYLALIKGDTNSTNKKWIDSSNSLRNADLRLKGYNAATSLFKLSNTNKNSERDVKIKTAYTKTISFSGSISLTAEMQKANRQPALQNEYVQGRNNNGTLTWQGPETNELHSYGPHINALEYEGSNYLYDINGRIVQTGLGNGKKVSPYNNSILRTGSSIGQHFTFNTRYKKNYQPIFTHYLKAGHSNDRTFIKTNNNESYYFTTSAETIVKRFSFSGSYSFKQEKFVHSNRNGFLNRVYQNSLLTPSSFSNGQGNTIGNTQRSYSVNADNALFLLSNPAHLFKQQQYNTGFSAEYKINKFKIKISQAWEKVKQYSNEGYQPGIAFFPAGINAVRNQLDKNYSLNTTASYNINAYRFRGQVTGTYNFNENNSSVYYLHSKKYYNYQRSSNDLSLAFYPQFDFNNNESGMLLSSKIYTSNTCSNDQYFLPSVSAYTRFQDLFNANGLSLKIVTSYNRFNSELPIDKSFAASSLLQYNVADAGQYLPMEEVNSFDNLNPVKHKEYTAGAEMEYKGKIRLSATWFNKKTIDDVFPIMNAGQLQLQNIASHKNSGTELELYISPYIWNNKKFTAGSTISFVSYRSKVTNVKNGYNHTAVAGFANVHKAIVINQPLGVIVSNTWQRDANQNVLIDTDGFPLVNNNLSVIGNPVPDFIMKLNNNFSYKRWGLNLDWEWKKGGDMWNGTQAMLDYYGRSKNSGLLRNTTNYVFNGTQANGNHNTVPVSFYDVAQPLVQNRWVRYGQGGVAEGYIQKADYIRLNTAGIYFKPNIKKYVQQLTITVYANNILLWSPYKGADVNQLLYDQPGTNGLDFFNLPSLHSFGFNVAIQF